MRATDLLGLAVYDADGQLVGHVHDLRFAPPDDGGCLGYRLTALACGDRFTLGHRLGYRDDQMAGPWPMDRLFRRWAARARVVEWQDVVTVSASGIEIRRRRTDLGSALQDTR